ncbi:DUF4105 domain-containing protein [Dasania sp. GY-MA-18]|uniref:DUF4105 domain-containing protein n=1 Tax=Dasania phycosphaerae TaxID=2950436 RepID=A0A9J6RMV7_9GAMM|nr:MULTISPECIES: DUF4105 domain-containing protein [Dasania]MCR8923071.1 DUF4105 domain-containing protein [Dasania sp. GY-MA-18]MCZ0865503.1 DUF4105 domain-containing protein [Dasania phycosphaerae]MCZ0869228.1 DUF4105 domain-containing protein [Dasania phycosphaerae]
MSLIRMSIVKWLVVVGLCYGCTLALAEQQLLSEQALQQSARDGQWLNLLHYKSKDPNNFWRNNFHSYVDDKTFFLSPSGYSNPVAELRATIKAFVEDANSQCKYPARKLWLLNRHPQLAEQLPAVDCADYEQWRKNIDAQQLVLVFASSYINSPSSMYGHTFLRVDPGNIEQGTTLLSYALSFGANIPEHENGFLYAYRGLFGGYPGTFDAKPYYEKVKEYSRMDNRDLWEYRLDFNQQELTLFMAHAWELNLVNFDYYFFDENCALRLMELLDIARPGLELAAKFTDVAIPIDTVRVVTEAGLVNDVYYRPSNQVKLQHALAALNEQEQRLAAALAEDESLLQSAAYSELTAARQQLVAHTAYSYLRYKTNSLPRDAAVSRRNLALLRAIKAGQAPIKLPAITQPVAPEQGHKTKMWALALGEEDGKAYTDVEFHMSYHDLLDNQNGYPAKASLNMGRIIFRAKADESVQLQRLDLIEIASLAPRDEFFKPLSWRVNAGLERQWVGQKDELASQVNGGAGVAYSLYGDLSGYALASLRLEYNEGLAKNLDLAPGAALGLLWGNGKHQALVAAEHYRFLDGVERNSLSVGYNWSWDVNHALRLMFNRRLQQSHDVSEASVSYRYYF